MIFLQILKIIGLILLIILAVILLLILLILLVPIRYRINGSYDENFSIKGNISWLFHFISYTFKIENEKQKHRLRILFFYKTFRDDFSNKQKKTSSPKSHSRKLRGKEKTTSVKEETVVEQEPILEVVNDSVDLPMIEKKSDRHKDHSSKRRKFHKINITNRAKELWGRIKYLINNILSYIRKFIEIYQNTQYHSAFTFVKKQVFILLKRICPKRMKLEASFSTGSPDTTGQILGILALFPFAYRNRWNIYPDFESDKFYINAKYSIKGHFYNVCILAIVIRILLNQDCRKVYHDFRK